MEPASPARSRTHSYLVQRDPMPFTRCCDRTRHVLGGRFWQESTANHNTKAADALPRMCRWLRLAHLACILRLLQAGRVSLPCNMQHGMMIFPSLSISQPGKQRPGAHGRATFQVSRREDNDGGTSLKRKRSQTVDSDEEDEEEELVPWGFRHCLESELESRQPSRSIESV